LASETQRKVSQPGLRIEVDATEPLSTHTAHAEDVALERREHPVDVK
jgi:hypothetical protein